MREASINLHWSLGSSRDPTLGPSRFQIFYLNKGRKGGPDVGSPFPPTGHCGHGLSGSPSPLSGTRMFNVGGYVDNNPTEALPPALILNRIQFCRRKGPVRRSWRSDGPAPRVLYGPVTVSRLSPPP